MNLLTYDTKNTPIKKLMNKKTELKVISHILNAKNDALQSKKKILEEKHRELDNINYKVWNIEDQFCDDVWSFSLEHDFKLYFNQYPEISETCYFHKCKYDNGINKKVNKIEESKGDILVTLKREIEVLKKKIIIARSNVVEDVEYYQSTLDNLKSFSEEILQVIRRIVSLKNSMNICGETVNKTSKTSVVNGFTSARSIFMQTNFPNHILTENTMPSSVTILKDPKQSRNPKKTVTFGKFIFKKQSHLSRRFEENLNNMK